MAKRGRPLQYGKSVTIRMHPSSITRLRHLSERWGRSQSDVVRELIAREVYEAFDAAERARLGIS